MLTKSVAIRRKVLARMPGGFSRVIHVNENTGRAVWVVPQNGKSTGIKGTIAVNEFGVDFIPKSPKDLQWILDEYNPQRNSYGPVTTDEEAMVRREFYVRERAKRRKTKI